MCRDARAGNDERRARFGVGSGSARSQIGAFEARAEEWRRDGQSVIDASAGWVKLQLEILAARSMVEQDDAGEGRGVLLRPERGRLDEARSALASL